MKICFFYLLLLSFFLSSCSPKRSHLIYEKPLAVIQKDYALEPKPPDLLKAKESKPKNPPKETPKTENISKSKKPAPAAKKKPKKRDIIVIDAGHGGKDAGAMSQKNHYKEKELTLKTAHLVKGYLESLGYPVILTRHNDTFVKLEERADLANTTSATLFVSIHYNTSPNADAKGIEIFYYKDEKSPKAKRLLESEKLGKEVLSTIIKHTGANTRGLKRANFVVIRETKMPAILIEGGFLSNPDERDRIKKPEYMRFLAWGIAKGIDHYLKKSK